MKAVKKYMAIMMSIFMIVSMWSATVYASVDEGDVVEEILDAEEAAPVSELDEETGPESNDTMTEATVPEMEEIIAEGSDAAAQAEEELVGDAAITVGNSVTATFDPVTGAVKFYSNGGTLWTDWLEKSGFDGGKIKSVEVAVGTVFLPPDSHEIFTIHDHTYDQNTSLTAFNAEGFNTANVTDMSDMFSGCSSLKTLDLSSFNTSNVIYMTGMFHGCMSLTNVDLSSFNTSNVKDMTSMFSYCDSLTTLDLSKFKTPNLLYMDSMFTHCISLTSLDLSSLDTSKVIYMGNLFYECRSLATLDLSTFDTSSAKHMYYMFAKCSSLTTLDLSNFNTSNVTYMDVMFLDCYNLKILNLSSFNITDKSYTAGLFKNCTGLQILETPQQNSNSISLPHTMYTAQGISYTDLPIRTGSIVLGATQKIARDYITVDVSTCAVTLTVTNVIYDGKAKEPVVTVKVGNKVFKAGTDYTVSYSNNTNVGTATVTITATETGGLKGSVSVNFTITKPAASGFSDVQDSDHAYYKAIYWAADAGITKGYPDGTFGINRSCTRGEMMMFLWRYAGKPAPKNVSKSPFKDVPKTHTFYKAILWGSQKGITKGYSDGTFGIDRNVSRGECMMFLWRLKGKPAPKTVAKAPFPDVPKSHVFYNAVLWGYQKKITTGFTSGKLKGKFGVNENCSRGQIVTFLYRAK